MLQSLTASVKDAASVTVRTRCTLDAPVLTRVPPTDEVSLQPRRFLVQVEATLKTLLSREDSDQNYQITIDDKGPKVRTFYTYT